MSTNSGGAASTSPSPLEGEGRGEGSTGLSSQLYYTARITLDRTTMNIDGKPANLTPGMAATVEIKTGKRKLIEYLLSPLMKMSDEAGRER